MSEISIVLPTYNEEDNISNLLISLVNILPLSNIVIVDDSPNNKTKKIIENFKKKNSKIHYIHRKKKMGRYSAVIQGMKYIVEKNINFDFIVEMDTDYSHPPEEILGLTNFAINKKIDICIASRDLPESKIVGWPLIRKLMHFSARMLCKIFIYKNLNDFFNAYRVYSKRIVIMTINNKFRKFNEFWGFGETLLQTISINGVIKERPTTFTNRELGKSSVNIKTIFFTIYEILYVGLILKKEILKNRNLK